jgi:hypothetical protein
MAVASWPDVHEQHPQMCPFRNGRGPEVIENGQLATCERCGVLLWLAGCLAECWRGIGSALVECRKPAG